MLFQLVNGLNEAAGELANHGQNSAADEEDEDDEGHRRQVQPAHQRHVGSQLFHHGLGDVPQNAHQRVKGVGIHPAQNGHRDDDEGINKQQGVYNSHSRKQGISKSVHCKFFPYATIDTIIQPIGKGAINKGESMRMRINFVTLRAALLAAGLSGAAMVGQAATPAPAMAAVTVREGVPACRGLAVAKQYAGYLQVAPAFARNMLDKADCFIARESLSGVAFGGAEGFRKVRLLSGHVIWVPEAGVTPAP